MRDLYYEKAAPAESSAEPRIIKQPFSMRFKSDFPKWLFMSPFIVGFSVFVLYPIIMSIVYSITDFNGIDINQWGWFNYFEIFEFDYFVSRDILHSFKVTFIYAIISIPVSTVLSYTLALALKNGIPGIKGIRLLFYLPVLIPSIVGGQIWVNILNYNPTKQGLLNQFLIDAFGVANMFYQGAEMTQLLTLIGAGLCGIGGGMIVWLAAFGNIPPTLYEAADIDGATYFDKLIKITIPMSTPILFYNLISAVIGTLQIFDTYSYLGTGKDFGLDFISVRIYTTAFKEYNFGMACAISWLLFIIIGILTMLMFKSSKWVFYGE